MPKAVDLGDSKLLTLGSSTVLQGGIGKVGLTDQEVKPLHVQMALSLGMTAKFLYHST